MDYTYATCHIYMLLASIPLEDYTYIFHISHSYSKGLVFNKCLRLENLNKRLPKHYHLTLDIVVFVSNGPKF